MLNNGVKSARRIDQDADFLVDGPFPRRVRVRDVLAVDVRLQRAGVRLRNIVNVPSTLAPPTRVLPRRVMITISNWAGSPGSGATLAIIGTSGSSLAGRAGGWARGQATRPRADAAARCVVAHVIDPEVQYVPAKHAQSRTLSRTKPRLNRAPIQSRTLYKVKSKYLGERDLKSTLI